MVKFISNIYTGVKDTLGFDSEPVRRTSSSRSTGGGQSGVSAYSDRNPTPKPIGGPLTGLGKAATSTKVGLGNFKKKLLVKSSLKFLNFFTLKNLNNKNYIIFITKKTIFRLKIYKLQTIWL